jgi:hypothetical protein
MDEIERTIRRLPNDELMRMVSSADGEYTFEALFIARDELRARGVSDGPKAGSGGRGAKPENGEQAENERQYAAGGSSDIARMLKSGEAQRDALLGAMLREELQYIECYEAISDFVGSMNIRCGEYQGSAVVFRKMDRENFILYAEEEGEGGVNKILGCVAIGKSELTDRLDEIARGKGFIEESEPPFEGYTF